MHDASDPSQFSLRNLVRQTAQESGVVDPSEVAALVLEQIPKKLIAEALGQALRTYVHHVLGAIRTDTVVIDPAHDGMAEEPTGAPGGWKRRAIRDYWRRALEQGYAVGGEYIRLGECGVRELRLLADDRRARAVEMTGKAAEFDLLARLLEKHEVERVADLPENVLDATLQRRVRDEDAA